MPRIQWQNWTSSRLTPAHGTVVYVKYTTREYNALQWGFINHVKKICKLLDCTVKGKHYNFFHSLPLPHPSLSYITKAVIPHTPWLPWQLVLSFLLKCSAMRNIYLRGFLTFENIGENQVLKKKKKTFCDSYCEKMTSRALAPPPGGMGK